MRILVVSQYFSPEDFRINSIVESLVAQGMEVEVLTGKPNYPDGIIFPGYRLLGCGREQWKGATVHRVPLVPRGSKSYVGLILNYLSFVVCGSTFGAYLLRKRQFDVIFVYGVSPILSALPALLIGWLKGIKVVTWVQDLWPDSLSATGYIANRYILSAVRRLVRMIYRYSDLILIQSKAFQTPVMELSSRTPIRYYPNSVDELFSDTAQIEVPGVDGLEEGFVVLFAGNIGAAQGVDVIVEAALLVQENKDIHFVIMGDGSCREDMMQLSIRHELTNVHFPGRYPVEMMPAFMKKASALIVTLTDQPIFTVTVPNKIQAYMAVGKPIIACLNGEGARLVVESGSGLATPAEDAKALAKTVLSLFDMSPDDLKKMGGNGRCFYREHFDHESLVEQLIGHFQSMLPDRKEA
jgi:glycosyltransferase involved in cell wall biosynthesis